MQKLEDVIEESYALGELMGASARLGLAMGLDIDGWSTEWTKGTRAEALRLVLDQVHAAAAYIEERR